MNKESNDNYIFHYLHGKMYLFGNWYKRDVLFGMKLIETAADNGNERAIEFLRQCKIN